MSGRRAVLLGLGAGLGAALAGCGYRPLLAPGDGGLAAVSLKLDAPGGRNGYAFRERWRRLAGAPKPSPAFRIEAGFTLSETGLAITDDEKTTRYDVVGDLRFSLYRAGEAEPVERGTLRAISAYSTLARPYATRIARRDVERRVARELAERLFVRLAPRLSAAAR